MGLSERSRADLESLVDKLKTAVQGEVLFFFTHPGPAPDSRIRPWTVEHLGSGLPAWTRTLVEQSPDWSDFL